MLEPKKRKRTSSEMTFLNDGKKDMKITALGGSNGQRGHAVAVVDKMVFDSNVKKSNVVVSINFELVCKRLHGHIVLCAAC